MKKLLFICGVACTIAMTSCSPKFYSPNTQNVTLLESKGDGNVSVAGNADRVEIQGSFAITEQVGLQLNGGAYIPSDFDNGNGGSGNFIEGGAGYFKPLSNGFIFETYGLVGFGNVENHLPSTVNEYPGTNGNISANLLRVGIQPSIGYKSEFFEAAVSTRFANLSYSNIQGNLIFEDVDQTIYLNDNKSNLVLEPALTLRGGLNKIKFQLQLGYSLNLSNSDFRQDNSFGTIGINYSFK